jgi:hypothetical protein
MLNYEWMKEQISSNSVDEISEGINLFPRLKFSETSYIGASYRSTGYPSEYGMSSIFLVIIRGSETRCMCAVFV